MTETINDKRINLEDEKDVVHLIRKCKCGNVMIVTRSERAKAYHCNGAQIVFGTRQFQLMLGYFMKSKTVSQLWKHRPKRLSCATCGRKCFMSKFKISEE